MLGRLATFGLTIGLSSVIGLISIPLLIRVLGAQAWAMLALTQAVALFFGILVAFGWGVTGPALIARAAVTERPRLFAESLSVRCLLFLLAVVFMSVVLFFVGEPRADWVILGSVTYLLPFLGASWFFVGEAKPWRLFFVDALPQLSGTVAGLAAVQIFQNLTVFLIYQAIGSAIAVVLGCRVVLRGSGMRVQWPSAMLFRRSLRSQTHGVLTAATGSLYVSLPLMAVSLFLPALRSNYALADKFFKFGTLAFGPVLQVIQGWIPEAGPEKTRYRMIRSVQGAVFIGAAGGVIFAFLVPIVSPLLSAGQIALDFSLTVPIGISFFAVAVSQVVGLACLMFLGESKAVAISTVLGAVAGAPLVIASAIFAGLPQIAWSVAISELIVTSYQLIVLRRKLKVQRLPNGAN